MPSRQTHTMVEPAPHAEGGAIAGVLLAAGMGRRFGGDKLLHALPDGQPMAQAAARALVAALAPVGGTCVAVVRPGQTALAALLSQAGCTAIECPEAAQGMGHSLACGVRATAQARGWLVALADMPRIAPPSYAAVRDALLRGDARTIAAPSWQGQRGHPVGFGRHWFEALSHLQGDEGARAVLAAARGAITLCPVDDEGVLQDVDRPGDLAVFGR